jgi:hypothetical protein
MNDIFTKVLLRIRFVTTATLIAVVLLVGSNLSAQSLEQRTTEQRTTTDDGGKVSRTTSVIETRIEDVTPAPKHALLISPVRLFWMYNLNYLHALNETIAIGGGVEFPTSLGYSSVKSGFGVTAEARFYPGRAAIRGFYVAPVLSFHSFTVERTSYYNYSGQYSPGQQYQAQTTTTNPTPFSMGVITGWTLFLWNDLAVDLGVGFKHHFISDEVKLTTTPAGYTETNYVSLGADIFRGTVPVVRINLGYAW